MLQAILQELELQKDYLSGASLHSVYLGGGTPSLLEIKELEIIFDKISLLHPVMPDAEITLEANPDDLSADKLRALNDHTPVNRLSIGIQSFSDQDLRWMNRAHSAIEARKSLELALGTGFQDLTVDLIYGAPTTSDEQWEVNLQTVLGYGIPHLSAYCLTVEDGTALGAWVKKGQQQPLDEETAARQFEMLMDCTAGAGYEHYEISNFAFQGRYSQHNTNYWRGIPYLGIGPSAHSFDGRSRQWNVANNAVYIRSIAQGILPCESETLTPEQRYNEYVMTSLRTIWGACSSKIKDMGDKYWAFFEKKAALFLQKGLLEQNGEQCYRLTRAGKLLADGVAAELFVG